MRRRHRHRPVVTGSRGRRELACQHSANGDNDDRQGGQHCGPRPRQPGLAPGHRVGVGQGRIRAARRVWRLGSASGGQVRSGRASRGQIGSRQVGSGLGSVSDRCASRSDGYDRLRSSPGGHADGFRSGKRRNRRNLTAGKRRDFRAGIRRAARAGIRRAARAGIRRVFIGRAGRASVGRLGPAGVRRAGRAGVRRAGRSGVRRASRAGVRRVEVGRADRVAV
jgi:hypothetical protein